MTDPHGIADFAEPGPASRPLPVRVSEALAPVASEPAPISQEVALMSEPLITLAHGIERFILTPLPQGVAFTVGRGDEVTTLVVALDRDERRAFSRGLLATTGDGAERTFRPGALAKPEATAPLPIEPSPIQAPAAPAPTARASAIAQGFTGDTCDRCGRSRMLRAGICMTCQDCGATTGCA